MPETFTHPCLLSRPRASARGLGQVALVVVLAVVGLVVLGAAGLFAIRSLGGGSASASVKDSTPQWAVVRRETIPIVVVVEGDLVAKDQVDVINLIDHPDDETIESIVEEGSWVKEGDWLYTLSAPGLVSDRDEWVSRVREAEAELEEAKRNLEIEKDAAASSEAKAQLTLELAKLAHKQWELGTHPQKQRDLALALEKAQRELDLAKRDLELSEELYQKDFISFNELELDKISLIEAENALETAKLDTQVYRDYEQVKQEKEMLSDIKQAQDELTRTKRTNQNKSELMQAKIDSEKNELDQRRTRLADLERMVGRMQITAPRDGMVLYASTIGAGWEKYRVIRPGAGLRGGQRVMVLSNTSQMVANLYVHESRINEVDPGQEVSIRVNARPEDVFTAKVTGKKNSAIQNSSGNPHLRQYQVLAEMPPGLGDDIHPGMNCSGEIYIREIPDALAVPVQAVHSEGEVHFVYVPAGSGKVRRQPVEMGGASDTLVHVKSGLEAGAKVLLRSPRPGELLLEEFQPHPETTAAAGSERPAEPDPDTQDAPRPGRDAGSSGQSDSGAQDAVDERALRRKERQLQRELGGEGGGRPKRPDKPGA